MNNTKQTHHKHPIDDTHLSTSWLVVVALTIIVLLMRLILAI